ncbi:hypothetical protein GK047_21635 [Paenibacillus sp. SYP-B3998]|uniref:Uncharacterized protein n=1 Tax=Paenibacillus sp. SYP-B3998 TaxID=2678564 RepID=A0A6G4A457_9BACL|nr:hypothetical protein [Paenibacillus sp. SYP-B3998]
MLRDCAEMC